MGHSMGGLLAQILASRELGKAAVLITPAAPYGIANPSPTVFAKTTTAPNKARAF